MISFMGLNNGEDILFLRRYKLQQVIKIDCAMFGMEHIRCLTNFDCVMGHLKMRFECTHEAYFESFCTIVILSVSYQSPYTPDHANVYYVT